MMGLVSDCVTIETSDLRAALLDCYNCAADSLDLDEIDDSRHENRVWQFDTHGEAKGYVFQM